MLEFIFWKVSLKGKAFTFIGVPPVAVEVVAAVVIMAVAVAGAAVVMALGKGFKKNPEKSSPRKKGGLFSGLLMRKGVRIGVISVPINALPA